MENFNRNFYKCGEITTSVKVGKKVFELTCIFCETVCSQLEAFASHIEENHQDSLYPDKDCTEEEYALDKTNNLFCGIKLQQPDGVNLHKPENYETSTVYEDPLLESPMSVNSDVVPNCTDHVKQEDRPEEPLESFQKANEEGSIYSELDKVFEEKDNDLNTDFRHSESDSEMKTDTDEDDDITGNDTTSNKDLLIALIAGYEKNPILWDPNDPNAKNRKKREDAFKRIGQAIKRKLNISISSKAVSERIKKIRYKFRSELQNRHFAMAKGGVYSASSIYFDKLAFLNQTITYKPRNKRGTKALANEKPALPLPNLTDEQNMQLIDIYKSFPCLWDMQHIGFRFKAQRMEAMNDMILKIKTQMKLNLTEDELLKKLYRIRYACTQEKHRKLECNRMQKEFEPSSKYFEHISFLVENVGPFKCEFCEETFNGADQYRIHKSKHDGSMPFVCPICNRGFMKVGNCTVHVRRHTRDYPFECEVCGKRFATTTDVNVHMRYHTGEKPYFCEVCGQSFRTWSFFDAHMRRHQKRPSHTCTICAKAFYENNKLTEHMKAHLNVRDKVCNICGKAFTSSKYLRQHKQIHAEKKKYVCRICKKDFAQYAGLSGHMKSHGTTVSGGTLVDDHY